jgi:hypothetical protein
VIIPALPDIAREAVMTVLSPAGGRGRLRAVAPPFFPGLPMTPVLGLPPVATLATRGRKGVADGIACRRETGA